MAGLLLSKISARPLILAVVLAALSKLFVKNALRKKIVSNPFWVAQIFLHPVIVFALVVLASFSSPCSSLTRNHEGGAECPPPGNNQWALPDDFFAILMAPFAFNFGVEPVDLPSDFLFLSCFYLHHIAVVLASYRSIYCFEDENADVRLLGCTYYDNQESTMSGYNTTNSLGLAQALLLAHAWAMHPIAGLAIKKIIDKQRLFVPYMVVGSCLTVYWLKQLSGLWLAGTSTMILFQVIFPVVLQYIGRWGLYVRLCVLTGWHDPQHPNFDAFEWNKQFVEFGNFVIGAAVVALYEYCVLGVKSPSASISLPIE